MLQYKNIVESVLKNGIRKPNRTGIDTFAIAGSFFEHDMNEGFPLLTTKKILFRLISSELEFFIKGYHSKKWLQERNNHIWDEWCNPRIVPYSNDEITKKKMLEEDELGNIYGYQWRHFGINIDDTQKRIEVDQLLNLVKTLKKDPYNRRMIVTAWNPLELSDMALPPCHFSFQVTVIENKLNLMWYQRSVDVILGLPFNIASYGLLLHLLAKESGFKEGKLIGFLGDVHIYENHIETYNNIQRNREEKKLPTISTSNKNFSIFDWEYTDTLVLDYNPHSRISYEIAI